MEPHRYTRSLWCSHSLRVLSTVQPQCQSKVPSSSTIDPFHWVGNRVWCRLSGLFEKVLCQVSHSHLHCLHCWERLSFHRYQLCRFLPGTTLYRSSALQLRPMANDVLLNEFGVSPDALRRINGPDGEMKTVGDIYHSYLMKPEGTWILLEKAQKRLQSIVFSDNTLFPKSVTESTVQPLNKLIQESLFRATIGSAISE